MGVFYQVLEAGQECACHCSVDQAVVEGKGEGHDGTDDNFAVLDDGFV